MLEAIKVKMIIKRVMKIIKIKKRRTILMKKSHVNKCDPIKGILKCGNRVREKRAQTHLNRKPIGHNNLAEQKKNKLVNESDYSFLVCRNSSELKDLMASSLMITQNENFDKFKTHFAFKNKKAIQNINDVTFSKINTFEENECSISQLKPINRRKASFNINCFNSQYEGKEILYRSQSKSIPMSLTISEVPVCNRKLNNSEMIENKSKSACMNFNYIRDKTKNTVSCKSSTYANKNLIHSSSPTIIQRKQNSKCNMTVSLKQSLILVEDQSDLNEKEKENISSDDSVKQEIISHSIKE